MICRLTQDEEAVISNQVARACPEADTRIELFQMANMIIEGQGSFNKDLKEFLSNCLYRTMGES